MSHLPDRERQSMGHTFCILRSSAGFLGLGVEVAVIENGEVIDSAVVYQRVLKAMEGHTLAEACHAIMLRLGHVAHKLQTFDTVDSSVMDALKNIENGTSDTKTLVELTNKKLPKRFQR